MIKSTQEFSSGEKISIWKNNNLPDNRNAILYFHGGGLIYGTRNDIPNKLIELFLNNGLDVISLDYLLAPNSTIEEIIQQTYWTVSEILISYPTYDSIGLCGRSAGSYLMFKVFELLKETQTCSPDFLINFYGYTDFLFLDNPQQNRPTKISRQSVEPLLNQNKKVYDDENLSRFLLYKYAIQENIIKEFLGINTQNQPKLTIQEETLLNIPALFGAASTSDKEVPFSYSKSLHRKVYNSTFIQLYDLEHDFLKEINNPQVLDILDKLNVWLKNISK